MALHQPLEAAVRADPGALSAALHSLKRLEMTVRTELGSALGVTVTFTSSDGD
jgi:predicted lipoprotein